MNRFLPIIFPILVLIFFWQFFFKGLLPIPADTIVGLYHPYRDLYAKDYPRGIPFKNFLITDPVRQQYPWKKLSIDLEKQGKVPLWNPYNFSGTPLLANFQSGTFYLLNLIFFLLPFYIAWSLFIFLSVLLAGIFIYFYLDNLKLDKKASLLGSIVFSFCGFSIAWLEWGNILHTALWLPLILLSIDKMMTTDGSKLKLRHFIWSIIFGVSLQSSFFAGHLQIFFYVFISSVLYFLVRWFQKEKDKKHLFLFFLSIFLFFAGSSLQLLPTLQSIQLSARYLDQNFLKEGWFIPWQNLIQFVAPDFFGNPATLNYWGIFNYSEFVGYIGILPLILAIFALFFRRDKKTLFFGTVFFLSLIFSLPTFFAKLPFILNIPFISTSQPTRLLFITDFSLAVLTALGFDFFLKRKKEILYPLGFLGFVYLSLWWFVLSSKSENLLVSRQNLILPTSLFISSAVFIFLLSKFSKIKRVTLIIYIIIVAIISFDLLRFGWKFTTFTKKEYLFPDTKILSYLQNQKDQFRIMSTDLRIFPPNFSTVYKMQSVDGYDPLYIKRYAELLAASERGQPNINPPFGFNRIITPHNFSSKIVDLLGVKYILSLSDLNSEKLEKVFQEGETRLYENKNAYPRVFFVEKTIVAKDKKEAIEELFDNDLRKIAVVENSDKLGKDWSVGSSRVESYNENKITIKTKNQGDGFLILADSFYPTWHARIDGKDTKIYRADYNFRGIVVSKGSHKIEFYITLF